jgi:hypothetical protein
MYETTKVRFSFDPATRCVFGEWKGFASGDEYRQALEAGLALLAQHRTSRWCADLREFKTATADDQRWTDTEWFPRAVKAGMRRLAVVLPESVIAQLAVQRQVTQVGDVESRFFASVPEAKAWLAAA